MAVKHAVLSASSSERWLNCPPSARLCEAYEDKGSDYAAYVSELLETAKQTCADPVILIEQRVDFSRWAQDGFGTADCIVIADGVLNIVDYKHGKG